MGHAAGFARGLVAGAVAVMGCASAAAPAAPSAAPAPAGEIDRLVHDVCDKQVVLLAEEPQHGNGHALVVRAALMKRLIEECKFGAVFVEAGIYDFLELQRAIAAGRATPAHLADAIGGLWSTAKEAEPWMADLLTRASAGQITLAGLDDQIGSTNFYVRNELPGELLGFLDGERRTACQAELTRYTEWKYDDANPFDDAVADRLRGCLGEIRAAIARRPVGSASDDVATMARSFARELDGGGSKSRAEGFNARDAAMYQNFEWQLSRLPRGTKSLVWCASVHAAKQLRGIPKAELYFPFGSYLHLALGDRAAAIGFSAYAGSIARFNNPVVTIPPAAPDSLEGRAMAEAGTGELRYVDRAQLARFGAISGRPLNFAMPSVIDWSQVLDGVVVLRAEQPPHYVRDRQPQRGRMTAWPPSQ